MQYVSQSYFLGTYFDFLGKNFSIASDEHGERFIEILCILKDVSMVNASFVN